MIDGLHFVKFRRAGKPLRWYVYAWRGGPQIMAVDSATKPKLDAAALEALNAAIADTRAVKPSTLAGLIRRWRGNPADPDSQSPEWHALAETTKVTWGFALNAIEDKWGATLLKFWSDPRMVKKVVAWRDSRADQPRAADMGIMVLRMLLDFGRLRGDVTINVADGIPTLYRGGNRADIVWTEEDCDRFNWHALKLDRPQMIDGLSLGILTGFRRADLITARKHHVLTSTVEKRALKTSRRRRFNHSVPRLPELDALLDELDSRDRADGVDNLLVTSFGRPWSPGGFTGTFNMVRDAAEIIHVDPDTGEKRAKHLHDLRGTYCTKLLLAGIAAGKPLTDEECAASMGWSPERIGNIRRTYVDQARIVVAIGERIRRHVP